LQLVDTILNTLRIEAHAVYEELLQFILLRLLPLQLDFITRGHCSTAGGTTMSRIRHGMRSESQGDDSNNRDLTATGYRA
jgi:hypothetical protein